MWLAYLDETGNTGRDLRSPGQPLHIIGALLVREDQIRPLQGAVRDLARDLFPAEHLGPEFEFHGTEIFGGSGRFEGWSPGDRVAAFRRIAAIVAAHDARVVIRGVNKPRLADRYGDAAYHPHDISLMYTLEEIERFARAEGRRTGETLRVLAVADENQETEDAALRDLALYQEVGTTWGWNPEPIDHLVDTMHFVDSKTNWIMQLADCVTFLAGRWLKITYGIVPDGQSAAAVRSMWEELIRPTLVVVRIWDP
jgi:hypothetical protein